MCWVAKTIPTRKTKKHCTSILYYPCFMGLSFLMLPSSRSYVERLELYWTRLLKSETGTCRLDSPNSGENWDYQTRLRGDWIPCLWPETRTGRLDSPDSDLKPGLADWGTPFLWLEIKPDRLDSLTWTSCTPWLWPETGTLKIGLPVFDRLTSRARAWNRDRKL